VKLVRTDYAMQRFDYPGWSDELCSGMRVYIIPCEVQGFALNNRSLIGLFSNCFSLQRKLADCKKVHLHHGCSKKFQRLVKLFRLDHPDHCDLKLDVFDSFQVRYPDHAPDAIVGAPLTKHMAHAPLDLLRQFLEHVPELQERCLLKLFGGAVERMPEMKSSFPDGRMRALNMRYNFKISPVAVCLGPKSLFFCMVDTVVRLLAQFIGTSLCSSWVSHPEACHDPNHGCVACQLRGVFGFSRMMAGSCLTNPPSPSGGIRSLVKEHIDTSVRRYTLPATGITVVRGGDRLIFLCPGSPGAKKNVALDDKDFFGPIKDLTSLKKLRSLGTIAEPVGLQMHNIRTSDDSNYSDPEG